MAIASIAEPTLAMAAPFSQNKIAFPLFGNEHRLAIDVSLQHARRGNSALRAGQQVGVEHYKIRQLPGFEGTECVLFEKQPGIIYRVESDGLFASEGFLRVQLAIKPFRPARDGGGHGEERIV